jgi:flagellar biosynthesis/type III secretory pathway protein FliH
MAVEMNMKSSSSKSWDLREGKMVQSWKPDEIFPSLTIEETNSVMDDVLRLFQPEKKGNQSENVLEPLTYDDTPSSDQPLVTKWNLSALENVSASDFGSGNSIPGIDGTPVRIAKDENQRMIAEARRQGEAIIQQAQKVASETLNNARQQVEQLRQEAYETGREQVIAELGQTAENAQLIFEQLNAWYKETIQNNETLIIKMVQKISHLLFSEGLVLDNEVLQVGLNRVMRMTESLGDIRIYLNQQDVRNLDPEWRKFQEALSGKKIQIIPSEKILPGGCFIQGEMGAVDARVETQLNAVMGALQPDAKKRKDISS